MTRKLSIFVASLLICTASVDLLAQNRGNILSFQGVEQVLGLSPGTFGSGLDGISDLGRPASIFNNPAGVSGIDGLTIILGGVDVEKQWWENQNYRPNRRQVTLPFYLEGLYIPDPANNGRLDSDVFYESLLDSSYLVANPEMGVEHFSEEAADWKHRESAKGFSHIGIAYPLTLSGKTLTLSAGYASLLNGISYDQNATYLSPHPAYIDYGMPGVVDGSDTVRFDWYTFERLQDMQLNQTSLAVGYEATENIHVGLGLSIYSGSSKEHQVQNQVGYFDLIDDNEFIWSYDTMNTAYSGEADYSGTSLNLGLILDYDHFRLGLSYTSKMDLTKDWKYDETLTYLQGDTLLTTMTSVLEGQDVMTIPASYGIGAQLMPTDKFTFMLSYELHPYGDADLSRDTLSTFSMGDMQTWMDQSVIQYGIRYQVHELIHLNGSYRSVPQVYIPDGAADKEAGPEAVSYRLGAELQYGPAGTLDIGVEFSDLKYQDAYFSNTNYAHEKTTVFSMSYIYTIK